MNITVECIHRSRDSSGSIASNTACNTDNNTPTHNKVTCRINSILSDARFHLPEGSIILNDIMNFSNDMNIYRQYDCVLEITSFKQVGLYTNYNYSIRGLYRCELSQKWLPKYRLYKNYACIELSDDIILISSYSNIFANNLSDGDLIEVIPQSMLNLRSFINYF